MERGMSQGIYRIEVGRQDPTLSVLQRLAEGLDMPLVSLIQEAQRPRKTGKSPKARSKKGRKP
jgi:predicted transcriptional regulator